jgi:hypothetical protein
MTLGYVDSLGFKYAKLSAPILLDPGMTEPVVVYPGGLQKDLRYEVQGCHSGVLSQETGAHLMTNGIRLREVLPGELLFLNLPDFPGSGRQRNPPRPPENVTKRRGTNLGTQGIEIAWTAASDKSWVSYYEVIKDGASIGKSAKGTYFFDHSPGARGDIGKTYQVLTVDGDGKCSSPVTAQPCPGDPEVHEPLGDFGPTQGQNGWRYEQSFDGHFYSELTWQSGGYEGFWAGSGIGRIGRLWMQSSPNAEIARTLVASRDILANIAGELQLDPSAEAGFPVFVRVECNEKQVWPASGWTSVPAFGNPLQFEIKSLPLTRGGALRFVLRRTTAQRAQPVIWNPTIVIKASDEGA